MEGDGAREGRSEGGTQRGRDATREGPSLSRAGLAFGCRFCCPASGSGTYETPPWLHVPWAVW